MAVGAPVVASALGGAGEYLRHEENSLIFDVEDGPAALAAQVRRLAADEGLRRRLRAGGLRTTAEIDEDSFYEALERLLEGATER
jgi:glycosyltransferase involved in cell wall biosynthesis